MVLKPSENEEEYFARLELERRKKSEEERLAKMAEQERMKLKELHYMRCPKCGAELTHIELKGIELDRCVMCQGTWFDHGEIEELMEQGKTAIDRIMSIFHEK